MVDYIPAPRKPKTLPVILSREEVKALLLAPRHLKHRAILATLYATGVRVAALCELQGWTLIPNAWAFGCVKTKANAIAS